MDNKEYIDRAPFIEDLTAMKKEYDAISIDGMIKALKEAPTADVAPVVHSEWVMIPVNGVARYRCGNIDCCRLMPFGCSPGELGFCPHCGARMDGGKHETD